MQLQPHHIGIVVSDLERSTDFYRAFGFEVAKNIPAEDGSRTIRFIRLGEFELELFWYAEPTTPPDQSAGKRQPGFRHFAFRTTDIDATIDALKAAGVAPPDLEIRRVPSGFSLAMMSDPDGLEIEVMQED